jgi:hypothetical protein
MTLTVGIELQQKETDEIYSTVANVDLSRGGVGGTFSNELFKSCTAGTWASPIVPEMVNWLHVVPMS